MFEDLIIVGGAPRSGTTLLQNMLDSNPIVYGGPEFSHLKTIIQIRRQIQASLAAQTIDDYLDQEALDSGLRDLALKWISPPAMRRSKKRISEKTPSNATCLAELLELFPKAVGIHLVRDPRAVITSMCRVRRRHQEMNVLVPDRISSVQAMAKTIAEYFLNGLAGVCAHPNRTVVIQYEKLVTRPEAEIRRVCSLAQLIYDPAMLFPANEKHDAERLVTGGTPWYTAKEFCRNPDPSRLLEWNSQITPSHVAALRSAFGHKASILGEFGYSI